MSKNNDNLREYIDVFVKRVKEYGDERLVKACFEFTADSEGLFCRTLFETDMHVKVRNNDAYNIPEERQEYTNNDMIGRPQ